MLIWFKFLLQYLLSNNRILSRINTNTVNLLHNVCCQLMKKVEYYLRHIIIFIFWSQRHKKNLKIRLTCSIFFKYTFLLLIICMNDDEWNQVCWNNEHFYTLLSELKRCNNCLVSFLLKQHALLLMLTGDPTVPDHLWTLVTQFARVWQVWEVLCSMCLCNVDFDLWFFVTDIPALGALVGLSKDQFVFC